MPELSIGVVVPTHNRPEQLTRALASILAQTLTPSRVIVVEDYAGPGKEVVSGALREGHGVELVYLSHDLGRGPATSRNLGAGRCKTDLVAFLDDDDFWLPNHLEVAVRLLTSQSAEMVATSIETRSASGSSMQVRSLQDVTFRRLLRRNLGVTGSNILTTASAFSLLDGYDSNLRMAEDRDLMLRAFLAELRVTCSKDVTVHQIIHDGPRMSTMSSDASIAYGTFGEKYADLFGWKDRFHLFYLQQNAARRGRGLLRDRAWLYFLRRLEGWFRI